MSDWAERLNNFVKRCQEQPEPEGCEAFIQKHKAKFEAARESADLQVQLAELKAAEVELKARIQDIETFIGSDPAPGPNREITGDYGPKIDFDWPIETPDGRKAWVTKLYSPPHPNGPRFFDVAYYDGDGIRHERTVSGLGYPTHDPNYSHQKWGPIVQQASWLV